MSGRCPAKLAMTFYARFCYRHKPGNLVNDHGSIGITGSAWPAFQPSESLKAMVCFEDCDLKTLSRDDRITLVNAVSAVRELPTVRILSEKLATKN